MKRFLITLMAMFLACQLQSQTKLLNATRFYGTKIYKVSDKGGTKHYISYFNMILHKDGKLDVNWGDPVQWFTLTITDTSLEQGQVMYTAYKSGYESDLKNAQYYRYLLIIGKDVVSFNHGDDTYFFEIENLDE